MQTVAPETTDHKYFTQTPNILWALCRDGLDLACWITIKHIAGDGGECILSAREAGQLAGMSEGKWIDCRNHLLAAGAIVGDLHRDPGYPQAVWHLRIPDLWPANISWRTRTGDSLRDRLADVLKARKSPHHMRTLLQNTRESSPGEGEPSPGEGESSPGEAKKNHKEEPKEEPKEKGEKSPILSTTMWEQTKNSLRLQLPRATYDDWLKPTNLFSANQDTITILAASPAACDWLNARLKDKTRTALASTIGHEIDVNFITAQEIPQ